MTTMKESRTARTVRFYRMARRNGQANAAATPSPSSCRRPPADTRPTVPASIVRLPATTAPSSKEVQGASLGRPLPPRSLALFTIVHPTICGGRQPGVSSSTSVCVVLSLKEATAAAGFVHGVFGDVAFPQCVRANRNRVDASHLLPCTASARVREAAGLAAIDGANSPPHPSFVPCGAGRLRRDHVDALSERSAGRSVDRRHSVQSVTDRQFSSPLDTV